MIRIDPGVYFYGALLAMLMPLDWLAAAVTAGAFHELCHMAAIWILGGCVREIRIGICGTIMETEIPGKGRELAAALAGPVGSFFLVAAHHLFPKLAICAFIQGVFNLIPIYPLDGGRAVQCCLALVIPKWAGKISDLAEKTACILIAFLAIMGTLRFSLAFLPICAAALIFKAILRKRPCKQSQIGVQ